MDIRKKTFTFYNFIKEKEKMAGFFKLMLRMNSNMLGVVTGSDFRNGNLPSAYLGKGEKGNKGKFMISIFHNLLDNAIEACMRMKQGEERRISFRTGVKNGQFVLSCVNTRRKNETILGKTWKKDSSLHGLGQKIVEDIVCEHKGNCVCDTKPDSWSVIITLGLY